ncbi:DUF4747 family protein [Vibrio vulnificus]|nr:DUF4747 family protein [Vibrio vulnificus]
MKKLVHSALNIVTHPHSPENYINLFIEAQKLEVPVRVRGEQYGSIIHVSKQNKDEVVSPILGEIVKYTNIDKHSDWYDLVSKDVASEEDQKKIKQLPDNLKPNMARFSFIFYPDTHLMVFETFCDSNNLSINFAHRIVNDTLNNPALIQKFGLVNVTVIPQTDKIDDLLNLKGLNAIRMVTNRPNPDELSHVEGQVKLRLASMNAISEERILKASRDEELLLDTAIKLEAKVAAKNGEVELKRYNQEGRKEEYNTKEHPFTEISYYNPKTSSHFYELLRVGQALKSKLMNWIS